MKPQAPPYCTKKEINRGMMTGKKHQHAEPATKLSNLIGKFVDGLKYRGWLLKGKMK